MMYRRYGKFCFHDYISAWVAIAFLFVLVSVGLLTETQAYLLIWPLFLILIIVWSIYKPNSECFLISGDTIIAMHGRKQQEMSIPYEATLIVSYADVCPSFAKHIYGGNQTYILRGRYAISILQKVPLETVFKRLHKNYAYKYTNSTVEACFDEHLHVYSFVGNEEIWNKLVGNRNYNIIIPESLLKRIPIDLQQINVHVDTGY